MTATGLSAPYRSGVVPRQPHRGHAMLRGEPGQLAAGAAVLVVTLTTAPAGVVRAAGFAGVPHGSSPQGGRPEPHTTFAGRELHGPPGTVPGAGRVNSDALPGPVTEVHASGVGHSHPLIGAQLNSRSGAALGASRPCYVISVDRRAVGGHPSRGQCAAGQLDEADSLRGGDQDLGAAVILEVSNRAEVVVGGVQQPPISPHMLIDEQNEPRAR